MLANSGPQDPWVAPDPMLVPVSDGARHFAAIARIELFRGRWQKLRSQAPQQIDQLRTVATIESAAASTRIEGAEVGDEEAAAILGGLSIDSFRKRDEQEVLGYRDLLEVFFSHYSDLSITESNLKNFHRILLAHSDKDAHHRGEYKRGSNNVERRGDGSPRVIFRTAPPAETRWWMQRLVDEFNAGWEAPDWHRLVLIADFVMWFLAIHPFEDGNGRLARALTTLLLLRADHAYVPYASLEGVIEDNKPGYYMSLQRSQVAARSGTGDYGDWLAFFLRALEAQQSILQAKVDHIARRQAVPGARARLLELITERGPLTAPAIAAELRVPERTVRYQLRSLTTDGLLEATTPTARRLYSLPIASVRPGMAVNSAPDAPDVDEAPGTGVPGVLTPLDFDPIFQRHATEAPNGRVYATVVLGAALPNSVPLGDAALDAFERFAKETAPTSIPCRASPEVGWWRIQDERLADRLQLWLYPGPLVLVHWALDPSDLPAEGKLAIDVRGLVSYWRTVITTLRDLMLSLDVTSCALGMGLTTYPAGRPYPVGFDFDGLPPPVRSGQHETPPNWHSAWVQSPVARLTDVDILGAALDQALRHFSYRHTSSTVQGALEDIGQTWDPNGRGAQLVGASA